MQRPIRWISLLLVGVLGGLAQTPLACAEAWPQRPVRIMAPFGPGSAGDVVARLFAEALTKRWKQPVFVEDRPGADGIIAVSAFVHAHDDHALLFSFPGPVTVLPVTKTNLPYDATRDLVPIASGADVFAGVATTRSLNVLSLNELVAMARSRPGALTYYGSMGALEIVFAGFVKEAGLEMTSVSYRDSMVAIEDLVQGRIHVAMGPLTNVLAQAQAEKVRLLAITNKNRSPLVPDVPTAIEAAHPELCIDTFLGFFGGRDTAPAVRDRIATDVESVAAQPAVAARVASFGLMAHSVTADEFAAALEEQRHQIAAVVQAIGLRSGQ
ncbi:MAG: tripartite tricarboxylate transporter substrate binding protein [Xanthobacteraceae bacterium]|nr:tripartite tricarboxylate transporter substrate binding protein [Xanthobacteraceae bacterium]